MKLWLTKAVDFLKASLEPPKHELNELDWKGALSPDKKRLSEHLSALANLGWEALEPPLATNEARTPVPRGSDATLYPVNAMIEIYRYTV